MSRCEAVIAVLQGLMSSKGGTSAGVVKRGVTGSELAQICQQSHVSVMGCNNSRQYIVKKGSRKFNSQATAHPTILYIPRCLMPALLYCEESVLAKESGIFMGFVWNPAC